MDAYLIFLGSGCLVCLMPLALYLLYLAHLNGRTPPALVPGPWDFGAVLLGLSGFLILAGPLLLTLVNSVWRGYMFGGWADLRSVGAREAWAGSLMAVGYLILVGVGIFLLLRSRRPVTAVYNVVPDGVEPALVGVLDELGYPWKRANGLVEIGAKKLTEPEGAATRFFAAETATVRVDTFASTSHATLRWGLAWDGVRKEVEAALARSLPSPAKNPVAGWMFTAAMAVMVAMLLWLVVLIYIVMVPPHG
ncbi:MAG: hypothetical protein J2P46_19520 [Zavarzinella sp.]|nr:hypothetical protein [Zavarzinella sp.]